MTKEGIEFARSCIDKNCGTCCREKVCRYKGAFDSVVKRAIHEVQADDYLFEMAIRCKFHMYIGGTTFKLEVQQ